MGLAGPRRHIKVLEIDVDGTRIRGVFECVNDSVLVTTRVAQKSAPLKGRNPEMVARDLLHEMAGKTAPAETGAKHAELGADRR